MERKIVDNPAEMRDLGKMATCLLMRQARRKGVKMEDWLLDEIAECNYWIWYYEDFCNPCLRQGADYWYGRLSVLMAF